MVTQLITSELAYQTQCGCLKKGIKIKAIQHLKDRLGWLLEFRNNLHKNLLLKIILIDKRHQDKKISGKWEKNLTFILRISNF